MVKGLKGYFMFIIQVMIESGLKCWIHQNRIE